VSIVKNLTKDEIRYFRKYFRKAKYGNHYYSKEIIMKHMIGKYEKDVFGNISKITHFGYIVSVEPYNLGKNWYVEISLSKTTKDEKNGIWPLIMSVKGYGTHHKHKSVAIRRAIKLHKMLTRMAKSKKVLEDRE